MFILKNKEQLERAIAKALKIRPRVEFDCFGRYRVSGSKGYYTVTCRKDERGCKTETVKEFRTLNSLCSLYF